MFCAFMFKIYMYTKTQNMHNSMCFLHLVPPPLHHNGKGYIEAVLVFLRSGVGQRSRISWRKRRSRRRTW